MTLESGLANLGGLEELLAVYDELGGAAEPELEDLVSPYRRCLGAYEILLKEPPFSQSLGDEAKCYLMNDAILIGLDTKMTGKTARQKRMGTLDKKDKKNGHLEIKRGALSRFKGKFKLLHYLDLHNCRLRDCGTNESGFVGLQLTHVCRDLESAPKKRNGTFKIVTKIAKLELWFPTEDMANEMHQLFLEAVAESLAEDEDEDDGEDVEAVSLGGSGSGIIKRFSFRRHSNASGHSGKSGSSSATGGTSAGRQRKWAVNRSRHATLEKSNSQGGVSVGGALAKKESAAHLPRNASFASKGAGSQNGDSVGGGLQLSDLEERYNVTLAEVPKSHDGEVDTSSFDVEFGEGRLGLSLASGPGVGVIVGSLAEGGFAETAGILVSDRVCAINDETVGLDDHWQDVLQKLKDYDRPVHVRFERFAARTHQLIAENEKLASVRSPIGKGTDTSAASLAKARELERILQKTERILNRGYEMRDLIVNLKDAPSVKDNTEARAAASVLDELFRTELSYVRDMHNLVATYVLPLRNKRVQCRCRDIEGGSVMCEHGLRSTCRQYSKDLQPMVTRDDLKGIFLNVETLMFVNVELLRILEMRLGELAAGGKEITLDGVVKVFAKSFLDVLPFFKLYSEFCHQYTHAVDRLLLLRNTNSAANDFIKDIERTQAEEPDPSKRTLTLSSLLIKPVQRICKYPLLFNELIRHAKPCVNDLIDLELAATEVQRIAESVDDQVGEGKQFEAFMDVYRSLGGEAQVPDLVTPARRFVGEALIMFKMAPFSSTTAAPRTLFIFNDLVIVARDSASGTSTRRRSTRRISMSRRSVIRTDGSGGDEQSVTRSIARFFSNIFTSDESEHKGSRKNLSSGHYYKITNRFELHRCQLGEMQVTGTDSRPECSFVVTSKERVLDTDGKSTMSSKSSNSNGSGKVRTEVSRYMLIFDDEHYMETTYNILQDSINTLQHRAKEVARGRQEFGARRERRNWAKKTNGALKARVHGDT